ncbi:MAG: FAD-dependent urate hydroxylase HpxO [Leptolyngbya sp. IPPAS B-1204]|nr:MAG: FAD-dependent urate hydroxylase HpxO [Leptolyngbya sp. IPPAS B-1204]
MHNLKVVIVGSGIGGLTAGIALAQAGYQVEIYDRVGELRPAGAGISLWSNGVKVLNRLGLGDQISKCGGQMDQMQYRYCTGELLNHIDLYPLIETVDQRPYPVARRDLQRFLLEAFPGKIRLNSRCVGVEQDGQSVTAIFADGHRATGDLLIAADGIRSVLRNYVLEREVEPRYAGYVNWNGLVPASADLAPPNTWVIYVGEHKRAAMMPVSDNRFYFFFDVPLAKGTPIHPDGIRAELMEYFKGWDQPVQHLIQRLDPHQTNRIEIHDVGPLERFVRGRVALLGDAAHTTTPDLGQGGCQALEDAFVLANYLLSTDLGVEDALRRYEAERMERTSAVVLKARKRTDQIHGKDPAVTQQWYDQLRTEPPSAVTNAICKTILAGPLK